LFHLFRHHSSYIRNAATCRTHHRRRALVFSGNPLNFDCESNAWRTDFILKSLISKSAAQMEQKKWPWSLFGCDHCH
jgi:hypothetical protein